MTNVIRVLISMGFALVCGCYVSAQEPVSGPISDAITNRVEKLFQRQAEESAAMEGRLVEGLRDKLEAVTNEVRENRKQLQEWNQSREGFAKRLENFENRLGNLCNSVGEQFGKWEPGINLVNRFFKFSAYLFAFFGFVLFMLIVFGFVIAWMYGRIMRALNKVTGIPT